MSPNGTTGITKSNPFFFVFFTSVNPLAFKHYQPEALVLGKKMKDHLRFAVCYWHTFRGKGRHWEPDNHWPIFNHISHFRILVDYALSMRYYTLQTHVNWCNATIYTTLMHIWLDTRTRSSDKCPPMNFFAVFYLLFDLLHSTSTSCFAAHSSPVSMVST